MGVIMKKKDYKLTIILLFFIVAVSLFVYIYFIADMNEWRNDSLRNNYQYHVEVGGLSGRHAVGTTTVMVPIPATKEGKLAITTHQTEPSFAQKLSRLHYPENRRKGPYFENTTETLDAKSINGNWTTFIAETENGYMLGFKTNASTLEDISFGELLVVVDHVDIFDPISKNSPILYPTKNISEISMIPYGNQSVYSSNPSYESYIYLSDNIENGTTNFGISLTVKNDITKWPFEYRGHYDNSIGISTNSTGKINVRAVLAQYTLKYGALVKLPEFEEPPEELDSPEGWESPELEIED